MIVPLTREVIQCVKWKGEALEKSGCGGGAGCRCGCR